MSINILNEEDNITTVHIPDRLEVSLIESDGDVEKLKLKTYFQVKTILPNGKTIGKPYLDTNKPLFIDCKGNVELTQALIVIQKAIANERYKQMTVLSLPETL